MLELAKLQPVTLVELAKIRNINERSVNRYGKKLCELIVVARERLPKPLQDKDRPVKKTQQHEAVMDILSAVVRIRAEQNSLNPIILATRKDLEDLVFGEQECVLLTGWRYQMAGRELQALLAGELTVKLTGDEVTLIG